MSGPVDRPTLLRGRNVVLRPLRAEDVERVAEIQAEPGVARWWGPPNKAELRRQADGIDDEKVARLAPTAPGSTPTLNLRARGRPQGPLPA